jgi:arsenate reductase
VTGIRLYHNPGCSKSRGTKEFLEAAGADLEVVEYLRTPLSRAEILRLLTRLAEPPEALVRKDDRFAALGLDAADFVTAESVADLLVQHPELMQRPVVVRGTRALIARPPERVQELL